MNYGPRVITSNVVLALDAADRNSYPGSGTLWKDLSGNNAHFTLGCAGSGCANPSFSNNAFKTSFTASIDNFATANGPTTAMKDLFYSDHTIEIVCKINSLTRGIDMNAAYTTEYSTSLIIWSGNHSGLFLDATYLRYTINNGQADAATLISNVLAYVGQNIMIHAVRISNTLYIYINGKLIVSTAITAPANVGNTVVMIGASQYYSVLNQNSYTWPSNVDFYAVKLYNIGFTQPQVTQNFNALRVRLGI